MNARLQADPVTPLPADPNSAVRGVLSGAALARAVTTGTGWERLVAGWLATYDSLHTRHA